MKRLFVNLLRAAALCCLPLVAFAAPKAKPLTVASPDGRIKVEICTAEKLAYSVTFDGKPMLLGSEAALILSDGRTVGQNEKVRSAKSVSRKEHIVAPLYRQSEFDFDYNETDIAFASGFGVIFRVSNEGVAYRFYSSRPEPLTVADEHALFNFADDGRCWLAYSTNKNNPVAMSYQNTYTEQHLTDGSEVPAFLPVTVETAAGAKVTVLESSLESYPGMFVECTEGGTSLKGHFARYPAKTGVKKRRVQMYVTETEDFIARTAGPRAFPWRVLAVTERDEQMPVNNLVYALADPNRIGDTEWIRPGFAAWEWWNDWGLTGVEFPAGINNETYKYYIDFAAANGLEYVVVDEGWYVPASGDMLTPIEELDLPMLIKYAAERNVKLVLWTVFNVLDKDLEEACSKYAQMGIVGFKVDFLDRDDQTALEMIYRIAECAARHHLILDFHGIFKPTGINRTYPNVVNYEAVFGMEEVKWGNVERNMPLYDVTFPFIRQMAGYTDYTPGAMRNATQKDFKPIYSNPMSMGTRAHQVATYVVIDSPFTMLCDTPTAYEREQPTTDFIASLPRIYDETRVLSGKLGEYVVIARRSGDKWYVGGLTSWTPRTLTVELPFLGEGTHKATLFRDGVNAGRNASDYIVEQTEVGESITVDLASGGGFVLKIE